MNAFEAYRRVLTGGMDGSLLKHLNEEEQNKFIPKNCKVLDIGAGWGRNCKLMKNFNNFVVAIEASELAISEIKSAVDNALYLDISIDRIPYEDNFFDHVMIFEVLEHLENPYHAIKEAKRVCKKNDGIIHVSIPNAHQQEGYKGHNHSFIYHGLFYYENFKKFIKQMYLKVLCEKHFTHENTWCTVYEENNIHNVPAEHYYFACGNIPIKYDILEVIVMNIDEKELYEKI